jgi:dUTP pyrophosphatase
MIVSLKVVRPLLRQWSLPSYKTPQSAGMDLVACIDTTIELEAGQSCMIPTGFAIHLNSPDHAAVILPRSGLGTQGLVLGNLVGLIDADYQGEIQICCWNRSDKTHVIQPGMRLAQLVILPITRAIFQETESFEHISEREEKGFGSTGLY